MKDTLVEAPEPAAKSRALWQYYVVPMAVFMAFTILEKAAPAQYAWILLAKICATSAALWWARASWTDIRVEARLVPVSVVLGLVLFAAWVGLDKAIPYPHLGARTAFNPLQGLGAMLPLFLAGRFIGLVVLVPVMEELFWRSFLLRYITSPSWHMLPLSGFSWTALAAVSAGFAVSHPEWLVAALFSVAVSLLLKRTNSLFACIVTHATTNLALGVYVLATADWKYW